MKKLILATLGIVGLLAVLARRHREHARNDKFKWWTPDV